MFFFVGAILLTGLSLLRKHTRIGFYIVQVIAAFSWAFVQYNDYFSDIVTSCFPLWVLASLAALAVKPERIERVNEIGAR